jgi:DNA (cytosine-5)-methyltransferase 1
VDLFCGAGGLTRGLVDAGFGVVGAVEVDGLAAETYATNFPNVTLWDEDIREIQATHFAAELDLEPGDLDLLAACPPCEGFSTMRTLNGHAPSDDIRNDLVLQLRRFIRVMRPKTVLVENVPALASDPRLRTLVRALGGLGYISRCDVLNAADFGVPQRRRRMLLVASRLGSLPARPTHSRRTTVRDWIEHLPKAGFSGDPLHDHGEVRSPKVAALIRRIPKDGGGRIDLPQDMQLDCHIKCDGFRDVYGRMAWNDLAPTITSGFVNPSKGRFLHPSENRTITLREGAALQTFPPSHIFSLSRGKYPAAEMIGNALPPLMVRAQAIAVAAHLCTSRMARRTRGSTS